MRLMTEVTAFLDKKIVWKLEKYLSEGDYTILEIREKSLEKKTREVGYVNQMNISSTISKNSGPIHNP